MRGLSPAAASGGHSSLRCAGLSLLRPLPLRSTGSRRAGSVVVAHGPSRSAACGILPDRGTNPRPQTFSFNLMVLWVWEGDSSSCRLDPGLFLMLHFGVIGFLVHVLLMIVGRNSGDQAKKLKYV